METIISARGVSKRYRLGVLGAGSLREDLALAWARLRGGAVDGRSEFWALKDVSFDIARGDVVGVIGRNGAGKSTLLKIMSRITDPTAGEIRIRGRVASLLEVGTGFHPELSGRDNIFLNGAILGMKRQEIAQRLDQIIAFSEVDKFIDTPVKRYSSGMYVRLAFAVAAHLEPDVLIVDEVLAVGDHAFQQKCLGRMRDVSGSGVTVLFVSHNMAAISALTRKCLYMRSGTVADYGATAEVISRYMAAGVEQGTEWRTDRRTDHPMQLVAARMLDTSGEVSREFESEDGFVIEVDYRVWSATSGGLIEACIHASDGVHLITLGEHDREPGFLERREPGLYRTRVRVPGGLLNLGTYFLRLNCGTNHATYDYVEALSFRVEERRAHTFRYNRQGHLVPLLPWATERIQA